MAMTKCRECGKERSTTADACPHCGAKVTHTSLFTYILGGIFAIIVVSCLGTMSESDKRRDETAAKETARVAALTTEQKAAETKAAAASKAAKDAEEAKFQRAILLAKAVKASMNDPSSLEIIDATATDAGAIGLKFRGKNSFGALVINYAVLAPDGKVANGSQEKVAPLWNKHIAGKAGVDLTSSMRGAKSLGVY